jgi:hypothetical protein
MFRLITLHPCCPFKIRGCLKSHLFIFTPKSPRGDLLIYSYLKSPPWGNGGKINLLRYPRMKFNLVSTNI